MGGLVGAENGEWKVESGECLFRTVEAQYQENHIDECFTAALGAGPVRRNLLLGGCYDRPNCADLVA